MAGIDSEIKKKMAEVVSCCVPDSTKGDRDWMCYRKMTNEGLAIVQTGKQSGDENREVPFLPWVIQVQFGASHREKLRTKSYVANICVWDSLERYSNRTANRGSVTAPSYTQRTLHGKQEHWARTYFSTCISSRRSLGSLLHYEAKHFVKKLAYHSCDVTKFLFFFKQTKNEFPWCGCHSKSGWPSFPTRTFFVTSRHTYFFLWARSLVHPALPTSILVRRCVHLASASFTMPSLCVFLCVWREIKQKKFVFKIPSKGHSHSIHHFAKRSLCH